MTAPSGLSGSYWINFSKRNEINSQEYLILEVRNVGFCGEKKTKQLLKKKTIRKG